MEGEDIRSGMKKKRSKKEIGFDSGDDEPIGSIFKVKRSRKKASCSSDAVRGKEDLEGMDDNDTLASFRKRLKGPKRDQGSGATRGASPAALPVSDEDLVALGPNERDDSTFVVHENVSTSAHTEPFISTENILNESNNMFSGKDFREFSSNGTLKLSGSHLEVDGGGKSESEFVNRNLCDFSSLDSKAEVQDFVLVLDPIQSDGSSLQSSIPDENGNSAEYHPSVPDFADNDCKLSSIPRVMRKAKMRKHGDMTYEGDADWEILINDHALNESQVMVDGDRTLRTRMKHESSLNTGEDFENVAVVAVSAGLKARKAGPIEKIKFKEILKRKGGLKEYLDCR
uniref:Uncharacterized protein n=1 Tax=Cajanus cajan TaxID=3821 RepID=A0A151RVL2_CAJCA|nr:hypothetical protein KK1_031812 [Cajanus cajan]